MGDEPTLAQALEDVNVAWTHLMQQLWLSILLALEAIARFGAIE